MTNDEVRMRTTKTLRVVLRDLYYDIYSIVRLILFILIIIVYTAYGVCSRTVLRISFLKYFLSSNESENIRPKNAFNEVYSYII